MGQISGRKLTALTCADHGRTVAETATDHPRTAPDHAASDPKSSCPRGGKIEGNLLRPYEAGGCPRQKTSWALPDRPRRAFQGLSADRAATGRGNRNRPLLPTPKPPFSAKGGAFGADHSGIENERATTCAAALMRKAKQEKTPPPKSAV